MINIVNIKSSQSDYTILVTYSDGTVIDFTLDQLPECLNDARVKRDETWMVENAMPVNRPARKADAKYYANIVTDWVIEFDASLVSDDNPSGRPVLH